MSEILIKVSVVLAIALTAAAALRRRPAALRHWVLAVGVLVAASAPVAMLTLPAWHVGAWTPSRAQDRPVLADPVSTTVVVEGTPTLPAASPAVTGKTSGTISIVTIAQGTWLAGALLGVCALLFGFARLKWLTRNARSLESGDCVQLLEDLARRLGVRRRIRLLQSAHPTLLVTWGVARPTIVLPSTAHHWSVDRMSVVLTHEIAHVYRADWVAQLAAETLRAVYWFNPLAWIVAARLRRESEYACDDVVLGSGVSGTDYASHLLALARAVEQNHHSWLPAPAMARPSSLEGRIRAMLNPSLNRTTPPRWLRVASGSILLLLSMPILALSSQAAFGTLSGSVVDQTNRGVPDVPVVVNETAKRARHEVRTDASGHYEFVGLTPGDYSLEIRQPGFAPYGDTISVVSGENRKAVELQLGTVEETIMVRTGSPKPVVESPEVRARRQAGEARYRREVESCSASPSKSSAGGGNILAPRKVVDVRPIYPENLKTAKVGGVVSMEAQIGTDGLVHDVRTLSAPDPQLEQAAVIAVQQWQFTPTLLNCAPVGTRMRVTTTFSPEQ